MNELTSKFSFFFILCLLTQFNILKGQNFSDTINLRVDREDKIYLDSDLEITLEHLEDNLSKRIPTGKNFILRSQVLIKFKIDMNVSLGRVKEVKNVLRKFSDNSILSYGNEKGGEIWVKLPSPDEPDPDISKLSQRNVLYVKVLENSVLINGKAISEEELRNKVWQFLKSDENNPNLPFLKNCHFPEIGNAKCRSKSVISLGHAYGTKYDFYLKIYDVIKNTYEELWQEFSAFYFGKKFENLNEREKSVIKTILPYVIAEL